MRLRILGICVAAGLLLGLAPGVAAAATVTVYKVVQAELEVSEHGKYDSGSTVQWSGEGHQQDKLQPEDEELPPLPVSLPSSGGGVLAQTDTVIRGEETFIDNDGREDTCGGTWTKEEKGVITVLVKPLGHGKLKTIWEIPHGIATFECGFGYDLLPSKFQVKSVVKGSIGDPRLVLKAKGNEEKTEPRREGSIHQGIEWDGTVVLKRTQRVG